MSEKFQIISASAGSGKTFTLATNVIIRILKGNEDSFKKILLRHGVDERFLDLMHALNPNSKNKLNDNDKHKIHEIMFSWFHPLKNEWYPYLHNLKKGENL